MARVFITGTLLNGVWVKMASPATLVTAGDLDGDGIDDLIGIWPTQGGVWVKYSKTAGWSKLSSTAKDIAAGDMNGDGRDDFLGDLGWAGGLLPELDEWGLGEDGNARGSGDMRGLGCRRQG